MKLNMQTTPWPEEIKFTQRPKMPLNGKHMKLGTKLARKVSLDALLRLIDREGAKSDAPSTVPNRKTADTQFIKPPPGG